MPTYEYRCPAGHEFELFQKISNRPRAKCPSCGRLATRQISGGAGLVFKGSGFYITDYGKDGKGPRKEPAKPTGETSAAPDRAEKPAKEAPAKAGPGGESASSSRTKKKASGE